MVLKWSKLVKNGLEMVQKWSKSGSKVVQKWSQQDHSRLKHPINSTVENLVFLDPLESEGSKNI